MLRENLLETALEELQDKHFGMKVNVTFLGEEGEDDGGLTQELFTEIFSNTPLFHGNTFNSTAIAVTNEDFLFLGQLVAYAVLHGHPGPRCLQDQVVKVILDNNYVCPEEINLDVVQHAEAKLFFEKVMHNFMSCIVCMII